MTDLESDILAVTPQADLQKVVQTISKIDAAVERALDLKRQLKDRLVEWIEENGPFEFGPIRYYVGTSRVTKCKDVHGTVKALLGVCDVDELCDALAAQPFKPATAKTYLGQDYEKLFETTETPAVKEGVIKKQLQKCDTRFLPQKEGVE